ncbi:hypothetical protein AGLY_014064 [Aphis glycines]|uniref:HAT C-terminal dimerisation domain-containing protein n=1 Tax=Aphis glycines TaxID=307491 RepID=A0A6G0T5W8_APHGL|nr:hypothetical protein AGLY_014064 [Aphis glycines]
MKYRYKRQCEFSEFQSFVEAKPNKLLQPTLEIYFRGQYPIDKKAYPVYSKLSNPLNKLYLCFLEYSLLILNNLTLEFQLEKPKIHTLYFKMESAYKTILESYYIPQDKIYLGEALTTQDIPKNDKDIFISNCLNFYVECSTQVYKRFPFNSNHVKCLRYMSFIDPKNLRNTISITLILTFFKGQFKSVDINNLDIECRILRNIELNTSLDIEDFWAGVKQIKNGDKLETFPLINNLVFFILTLPHSTAAVERIFSTVNFNKTKLRNCLSTDTLVGILHSKRVVYICSIELGRFYEIHCYYITSSIMNTASSVEALEASIFFSSISTLTEILIMNRNIITKKQRMNTIGSGLIEIERFRKGSKTFIIKNCENYIDYRLFFNYISHGLILKLKQSCIKTSIKFNLHVDATYIRPITHDKQDVAFKTSNVLACNSSDFASLLNTKFDKILAEESEFIAKGSGWTLVSIDGLQFRINLVNPLKGGAYLDLPKFIREKKAIIDVKNKDKYCFKYSILTKYDTRSNKSRFNQKYFDFLEKKSGKRCFTTFGNKPFKSKLWGETGLTEHKKMCSNTIANGLKLVKIHRAIKFSQSKWMASYIELCTRMRREARNRFEKDF